MSAEVAEPAELTPGSEEAIAATFAEWDAKLAAGTETEPEKDEEQAEETEQDPGDETPAEEQAGDETTETETVEEEEVAEGPSFLMKRMAEQSGVDPKFIAVAKDDAQLEQMIVAHTQDAEAKEEPLPEFALELELPEDEYPADDPMRKQLEKWKSALVERQKLVERVLGGLAQVENERMDREQAALQKQVFGVFDEVLDSYQSKELGKAGSAARKAIAETYVALGATPDMPAEEKRLLAELALTRHKRSLVEQHKANKQAAERQQKRVTGGKTATPVKGKLTREQALREFDEFLRNGKPLE